MKNAAELVVPVLILALIAYSLCKKVNIYKAFIDGARSALPELVSILPSLGAMLAAISLFRGSGALDMLTGLTAPVFGALGIERGLVPLVMLRPFSGSAALAMLKDTISSCGADGYTGRAAAVLVGSTETIFYTTAVYFGAAGVTKTRHALPASLIAGAVGAVAAVLLCRVM